MVVNLAELAQHIGGAGLELARTPSFAYGTCKPGPTYALYAYALIVARSLAPVESYSYTSWLLYRDRDASSTKAQAGQGFLGISRVAFSSPTTRNKDSH